MSCATLFDCNGNECWRFWVLPPLHPTAYFFYVKPVRRSIVLVSAISSIDGQNKYIYYMPLGTISHHKTVNENTARNLLPTNELKGAKAKCFRDGAGKNN